MKLSSIGRTLRIMLFGADNDTLNTDAEPPRQILTEEERTSLRDAVKDGQYEPDLSSLSESLVRKGF